MLEQEDAVSLDSLLLLVTSPIWLTAFAALVVAGWFCDWRERGREDV